MKEISLGKLDINSELTATSVQLDKPIGYYKPYSPSNPTGYDNKEYNSYGQVVAKNGKPHIEAFYREQIMAWEILDKADEKLSLSSIDAVTFIMYTGWPAADNIEWSDLLWPHNVQVWQFKAVSNSRTEWPKTEYYIPSNYETNGHPVPVGTPSLKGSVISEYQLITTSYIKTKAGEENISGQLTGGTGVFCHELMHSASVNLSGDTGAPDLYRYTKDDDIKETEEKSRYPVGEFDIMGSTSRFPQYPLSYMREKLGYIDDSNYLYANKSGPYKIYPASAGQDQKAIKIVLSNLDGYNSEYFFIELRDSGNIFDGETLSQSGLIIYRVNEAGQSKTWTGNMFGPPDEVYVFRKSNNKGCSIPDALLTAGKNFGSDKASAQPAANTVFYYKYNNQTSNKNSGIVVSNITANADGSFSFQLEMPGSAAIQATKNYPKLSGKGVNDITLEMQANLPGKAYYLVLDSGSPAPTQLSDFTNPALDMNTMQILKVVLPWNAQKKMDIYVIFEDEENNLSTIYKVLADYNASDCELFSCALFPDFFAVGGLVLAAMWLVVIKSKK